MPYPSVRQQGQGFGLSGPGLPCSNSDGLETRAYRVNSSICTVFHRLLARDVLFFVSILRSYCKDSSNPKFRRPRPLSSTLSRIQGAMRLDPRRSLTRNREPASQMARNDGQTNENHSCHPLRERAKSENAAHDGNESSRSVM